MNQRPNNLCELVSRLIDLQEQARALGIFVGDRELLQCSVCGLVEDVTYIGQFITCRTSADGLETEDTGLRFEEISGGGFRCPACGSLVQEDAGAVEENDDVALGRYKKGAAHA